VFAYGVALRWAALEAVSRQQGGTFLQQRYRALSERRNSKGIAKVAVARRLLHLAYYGLRDGEIRCLTTAA
jgi:hypothetical protein